MKKYCVHIYQRYEYENVLADSPAQAEAKIVDSEFAGDYDDIAEVNVLLQCDECGYDNDPKDKKCAECGIIIK